MAKTVKEYLVEKGVRREMAQEMDEITLGLHLRLTKMKREGAEKAHILLELGKYRHLEQKNPRNNMEMLRVNLDMAMLVMNIGERFRSLENFGLIKFNPQTVEYEFTAFGRSFYAAKPAAVPPNH